MKSLLLKYVSAIPAFVYIVNAPYNRPCNKACLHYTGPLIMVSTILYLSTALRA